MYQNIFGVVILTSLGWIGVASIFFGVAILVIGLMLKDTDLTPNLTPSPPVSQQTEYFDCPNCNHMVRLDFLSCPHCGIQFRKKCPVCGQVVPSHWKFCPHCNTKFPEN